VLGISIVPGSRAAKPYNVAEPELMPREDRETLREFLDEVRADFDVVLIDCPPNLCGCSFAAMAASDHLVVPVQPEDYGAQGVADVLDSLAFVQGEGYHVDLLGFLLTMVSPRQTLHQLYEGNLRDIYRNQIFTARFPRNAEYAEAIAQRQLIQQYKPKGAATKAVKAIADEMLSRIAGTFVAEGVAA
jgi:chromosome partitioning protein